MDLKPTLEGKTLESILTELVDQYGFAYLGERVTVNCFTKDPSITSSLKFLRRTPWARTKVERLYLAHLKGELQKSSACAQKPLT